MSARFSDLIYARHVIRSDGAHWVDGERDDSADRSWLTVDGSQIVLAPGMYDELLAVPRLATDEEAQSWAELTGPIFDAEPFVRTISKVDEHGASLSVLAQKADEISSTVARVMPGGDIYTTIQQTAEDVAQRVVKKGEVITEINASQEGVRIAGDKIMLDGNTQVVGRMRITPNVGGSPASIVVDDGVNARVDSGDISGRPWGAGVLPQGTYGIWGDRAGLYLRGYANTIIVAYAKDEELVDLRAYNPANPQIVVAPKSMLTYSPQQKDAVPVIFTDAVQEEAGKFRIKAKTLIRGAYSAWPAGWTEGTNRAGAWQQPQTAAPNGKKGVDTNFIRCRVYWFASSAYVINVDQWVTNEFNASGQPINWQQKRHFSHQGPLFGAHSGTLDWDLALPQGQWAIRVTWDGGNPLLATYATAEVVDAGYRSDVYLGMDGSAIAPDAPSGMDVMYYAFDQG